MSTEEPLDTGKGSKIDPNDPRGVLSNKLALTTEELATRWDVSPEHLVHLRHRKTGPPYFKVVHKVRYLVEDVEAWEADHRHLGE